MNIPLIEDEIARALEPKFNEVATALISAKNENRFVLLRFHHDADGISGAFALNEVLRFSAQQQNSAVYSVKDAIRDLNNISNEDRPLVILLDFGMNADSEEGLRLLKASGAELILIDHHPPSGNAMGLADHFITPWEFGKGESCSKYVAGYLASEIARASGVQSDVGRYARIACAGDKSNIVEPTEDDLKAALVLDYLAAHSGYGNNLRFYKNVLSNDELFKSMYQQADEKINEVANKAMRGMRERRAGRTVIFQVNLEKIIQKGEFPNRSKVTTRITDRLKRDEPMIVLGLGDRTIIMRLNQAATDVGLSADKIAKKMLETMRDFAESGGGHAKAGAIRVKPGFVNSVVEEIVKMIGEN